MLVKDRFLKKINLLITCFVIFNSNALCSENVLDKLKRYNLSLENTSAVFMQSNGKTIEEGIIYFGKDRIKVDYIKPEKISLILSKKRGMYTNHLLEESEFFNINKSYVKFFLNVFIEDNFLKTQNIKASNDFI